MGKGASLFAACGLAIAAVTGCQRVPTNRPVALNDAPLIIDEAMQLREWDRSTAYYANTATVAGPHGRVFEPKETAPAYQQVAVDVPLTLTNFVIMPYTFFRTPPWRAVAYRGAITPPTYTAMPLLAGEAWPAPAVPLPVAPVDDPIAPPGAPGTPDEPTPVVDVPMPTQPATMHEAPDRPVPVAPDDPSVTPGDPPAAETRPDADRRNDAAPDDAPAPDGGDLNK